jgi:uncharacterized NAD(P)/FAD-binding protein YdhS
MKSRCSSLHISIIGAGASGTTLAIQLLKEINFPATVLLIERDERLLHRGVAYSSLLPYEPLNVPAGKMSIQTENPDDFYEFVIKEKDSNATKENFVSRRWFGDYLTKRFKEAYSSKHRDVVFEKLTTDVVAIENGSTKNFELFSTVESITETDVIVLATGNETPLSFNVEGDFPQQNYYSNPWNFDVTKIENDKDVLIIGSGLTMIDIAGSFYKNNHTGKIHTLSRKGKFPCVHSASPNARNIPLNKNETVETVFSLIRNEIKAQRRNNIHWSRVIDALRPHSSSLWQNFSDDDKAKFLKRIRPFWDIHRHRMPPASDIILSELKVSKQLQIHAGSIQKIQWNKSSRKFSIEYFDKNNSTQFIEAHYVVNCTGPATNYHKIQNPLFKNLLQQERITPDKHGLGFSTEANGAVIGKSSNIYAIGPLRKASEFESTAMREIVQHARQLSSEIIAAHPDMDALISELKQLTVTTATIENIQQILNRVSLQKLNYNSLLPSDATNEYKRIKLLSSVVECTLIYWSPGASSAIHNNRGYEGLVAVLEGSIYESKYQHKGEVLAQKQSNLFSNGDILFEKNFEIHKIENAHSAKPAVTLHVYIPPPASFENTLVFDEHRKKIGVLSADAEIISWNIPASHFSEIKSNAFVFEPLLEFMI